MESTEEQIILQQAEEIKKCRMYRQVERSIIEFSDDIGCRLNKVICRDANSYIYLHENKDCLISDILLCFHYTGKNDENSKINFIANSISFTLQKNVDEFICRMKEKLHLLINVHSYQSKNVLRYLLYAQREHRKTIPQEIKRYIASFVSVKIKS